MASPNRSGPVGPDQGLRCVSLSSGSVAQCGGDPDLLLHLAASCGFSVPSSDPEDPNGWDPTTDEHMDQTKADAQRLEAAVVALGSTHSDERIMRVFVDAWKLIPGAQGGAMFSRYIESVPEADSPRFRQIGAEAYRLAVEELIGAAAVDAARSTTETVAEVRHEKHEMLSAVASSLAAERERRRWRRSAAWSIRAPVADGIARPHISQVHRGPSRQARATRRARGARAPSGSEPVGDEADAARGWRRVHPALGHRGAAP
jgi:hypothetical protein